MPRQSRMIRDPDSGLNPANLVPERSKQKTIAGGLGYILYILYLSFFECIVSVVEYGVYLPVDSLPSLRLSRTKTIVEPERATMGTGCVVEVIEQRAEVIVRAPMATPPPPNMCVKLLITHHLQYAPRRCPR